MLVGEWVGVSGHKGQSVSRDDEDEGGDDDKVVV